MRYDFQCPKCGNELIVKDWRERPTTRTREPWCFCPKCKYKTYAEKLEKKMPDGNFCMECEYSEEYCTYHEDIEWNDGYYFEAMDRCHTMMVMISELLMDHPAIRKVGVQKNIDKAAGEFMHAYQKLGEADFYGDEE